MTDSETRSTDAVVSRGSRRTLIAVVALAVAGLALGACGKGSSSSDTTTTQVAATSAPTSSTTVTTRAGGASTTTLVPTPPPQGLVAWMVRPSDFGAEVGKKYSFSCPAEGDPAYEIWGVGPYTDDSAICVAAVHAGLITAAKGGTVSFEIQTGSQSYRGSTANGITSLEYGPWPTQYTFLR